MMIIMMMLKTIIICITTTIYIAKVLRAYAFIIFFVRFIQNANASYSILVVKSKLKNKNIFFNISICGLNVAYTLQRYIYVIDLRLLLFFGMECQPSPSFLNTERIWGKFWPMAALHIIGYSGQDDMELLGWGTLYIARSHLWQQHIYKVKSTWKSISFVGYFLFVAIKTIQIFISQSGV